MLYVQKHERWECIFYRKAKQQILTFKKVEPVTDWHFYMNDA